MAATALAEQVKRASLIPNKNKTKQNKKTKRTENRGPGFPKYASEIGSYCHEIYQKRPNLSLNVCSLCLSTIIE